MCCFQAEYYESFTLITLAKVNNLPEINYEIK